MDKAVFCDSFGGGNETPRYVRRGFAELFTKAGAEKKKQVPSAFVLHQGWRVLVLSEVAEVLCTAALLCSWPFTCIFFPFFGFYRNLRCERLVTDTFIA